MTFKHTPTHTEAESYLKGFAKGIGYKRAFEEVLLYLGDEAIIQTALNINQNTPEQDG